MQETIQRWYKLANKRFPAVSVVLGDDLDFRFFPDQPCGQTQQDAADCGKR